MNQDVSSKVEGFFKPYPIRKYKKGQVLILNGDEPKDIYFLASGNVKQYDVDYRGEEITLNIYKPGAFFPMSFALNGGASQFIFEAATDIEVRSCPMQEMLDFLFLNPDVLVDLLARVYRGADALLGRIFQLASGSARSRLSYELVISAERFGEASGGREYTVEITEKDLAAQAGLTRETVSREVQKLKAKGLIRMNEGRINIPDLSVLKATID